MSRELTTYDVSTGELRSNSEAFSERDDAVDSIMWKKKKGETVAPGDLLAEVQWATLPKESLSAPDSCSGTLKDINGTITYEDLPDPPSQYFAQIK